MVDKDFVLWGTGKLSVKYSHLLRQLGMNIINYCDNNSAKWNILHEGVEVISPKSLEELSDINLLIACADIFGVKKDISVLCLSGVKVYTIDTFYKSFLVDSKSAIGNNIFDNKQKWSIVIDNFQGTLGGAEDWAHIVGDKLYERGHEVVVLELKNTWVTDALSGRIVKTFSDEPDFLKKHNFLVDYLINIKPFVLINIWNMDLLVAAAVVRRMYPGQVKIVSSVLNDTANNYELASTWHYEIDSFVGISSLIADKLKNIKGLPEEKVLYRLPFIVARRKRKREYSSVTEPLRICYPCRLEIAQKRADLIPHIMEMLNTAEVQYELNIVGQGKYEAELKKYVSNNGLRDKVNFLGWLPKDDLISFFYTQDVYLNTSEYEGTSLTMLEAMASGCVPVVTDVSGVADFIQVDNNGIICTVNDVEVIGKNLINLARDRSLLSKYGISSMEKVFSKCILDDYIDFMEQLIVDLVLQGDEYGCVNV